MEYAAKISLIGDEHTGKTSLIQRYINNTFSSEYKTTLGADFIDKTYTSKEIDLLGKSDSFAITFWDMAGQAHYLEVASLYLEGSSGVFIVFDQNNEKSFHNMKIWIDLAKKICSGAELMVLGNKTDLENKISEVDYKLLTEKYNLTPEFASAKTSKNVDDVFKKLATRVINKNLNQKTKK